MNKEYFQQPSLDHEQEYLDKVSILAMQTMLNRINTGDWTKELLTEYFDLLPSVVWLLADDMLKERKKREGSLT